MGMTGEKRRRLWRRIVVGWVVAVAVGGGLTLWLDDSARPPGPYSWQQAEPSDSPSLPEDREAVCPSPTIDLDGDGVVATSCLVTHG
jgi:hypothetical protein